MLDIGKSCCYDCIVTKKPMTLPSKGKKLSTNEIKSISIALKDVGIRAIHPEKMESFADYLVNKLKDENK
jgi:hypothetical protein